MSICAFHTRMFVSKVHSTLANVESVRYLVISNTTKLLPEQSIPCIPLQYVSCRSSPPNKDLMEEPLPWWPQVEEELEEGKMHCYKTDWPHQQVGSSHILDLPVCYTPYGTCHVQEYGCRLCPHCDVNLYIQVDQFRWLEVPVILYTWYIACKIRLGNTTSVWPRV